MNENAIVTRLLVTVLLFANNKRPSRAARAALLTAIRLAIRQAASVERKAAAE